MSDGVPIPTLTWYNPDGGEIKRVKALENTVQVTMMVDQVFGDYRCSAANGLPPSDERIITIKQISKLNSSFLAISSYDQVVVLYDTLSHAIENTANQEAVLCGTQRFIFTNISRRSSRPLSFPPKLQDEQAVCDDCVTVNSFLRSLFVNSKRQ